MDDLVRTAYCAGQATETESCLALEWLVTNGLGGYASGTIGGVATRRYHGLLVAALPAPLGRTMMFNRLVEQVRLPNGMTVRYGGAEMADRTLELHGSSQLREFRLELGLPVWRYAVDRFVLEKRLFLPYMQNTVHIVYRLVEGNGTIRLKLQPSVHFRSHDAPVNVPLPHSYLLTAQDDRYELSGGSAFPPLRLRVHGPRTALTLEGRRTPDFRYRIEESRGYEANGALWSPGYFRVDLSGDQSVSLVASTESWDTIQALSTEQALQAERQRRQQLLAQAPPELTHGLGAELVLAADQFIITPAGRVEDAARARASGDDIRTVIAGYHWFTDWGRDTMISLEGLTLATGRHRDAGCILRTFGHYVRDGLIPNLFPEGEKGGLYHTADASLWYFHALHRYLLATNDQATLASLLPQLIDIIEHHLEGTRFGIGVDPADGLLRQGAEGYQLTWMDAKVGDWVVTPRRGKAVEINALWYNALRLLQSWLGQGQNSERAARFAGYADRVRESFNRRFWNARVEYLFDVVDGENGDDLSLRPNQVLAIALDFPVLHENYWRPILETVARHLLTPVGLRSLAPGASDYKAKYDGDLRARDAAYHQGTVWAWLIGPFVDAWLKVHPDDRLGAQRFLSGFAAHVNEACVGTISEIFDAEEPYLPRGCVAQAWSVAEVLRAWLKTGSSDTESPTWTSAPPEAVSL
jgi:predicted glycogen debranching enzyme